MQFFLDNWQLIFGGLGTAVVAAVVGAWAKSYFEKRQKSPNDSPKRGQQIRSGANSTNVQAGRDANVGTTKD